MFVLPVVAFSHHPIPAVVLKHANDVSNLHALPLPPPASDRDQPNAEHVPRDFRVGTMHLILIEASSLP